MTDRQSIIDQFKAKLDQWDAEIDELEAKARGASAEARANLHEQISKLKDQRGEAGSRLDELRESSQEAWQEVQAGAQRATEALGESLRAVREKF
ncbi:hypothetical protein Thiowin_03318 [Thiorhodovibrio winogradskyi]|uniref:Coiled coil domain-containing protein n=1 Tax=Thiorhodovibrio winogradskyi TaxID=77007 RepID=A0ABZ0SD70_9GAMM|nr:hypothetical protein [Thiorhodovibrio winogradskyi]